MQCITYVVFESGLLEVFVDKVCPVQELGKVVVADEEGDGHPDGAPEGVAAADPIPELEHVVLSVDPELSHFGLVGRQRDKMLGHCGFLQNNRNFTLLHENDEKISEKGT